MQATSDEFPRWYALIDGDQSPWRLHNDNDALQTCASKRGHCHILFEGYLNNSDQLHRDLDLTRILDGVELITTAWLRWGPDVFKQLYGRYLLAIWDAKRQRLHLGHDGLGRHPVYYCENGRALLFSSNIFALAYSGHSARQANRLSFARRIIGKHPMAGETFFTDIQRLSPGHYLTWQPGFTPKPQSYLDLFPLQQTTQIEPDEAGPLFEQAFADAVARCMQRAPQGLMFSGGMDSVSVAIQASQYLHARQQPPLTACSGVSPPGFQRDDEQNYQAIATKRLGMRLWTSHAGDWLGGEPLLEATLGQVSYLPAPTDTWWAGAYIGFYRHIKQTGIDSVLTGSGGDEWLGVHPVYAIDLLRQGRIETLRQLVLASAITGGYGTRSALQHVFWVNCLKPMLRMLMAQSAPRLLDRLLRKKLTDALPDWLAPDPQLAEQLIDSLIEDRPPELSASGHIPENHYRHSLHYLWRNTLMTYEFERQYHLSRTLGMEFGHPFHDLKLTQLCNSLPPESLFQSAGYKGLLRTMVANHLPGCGFDRQRKKSCDTTSVNNYAMHGLYNGMADIWPTNACRQLEQLGVFDSKLAYGNIDIGNKKSPKDLIQKFTLLSCNKWFSDHCL